ncbi:Myeloid leukemia factor 1, partial [Eschrichtius robustus]|nr:Myeloid leukemia factor 1 [Eschrichtius robustus]
DSFMAHRESMRQMMRNFSEPFGRDLFSISDGRGRARNHMGHEDEENSLTRTDVNPFQAMDRMMLNMRNSMQELQRNFDHHEMTQEESLLVSLGHGVHGISDAHAFDDEWQNEVLKYQPRGQWHNLENSKRRSIGHETSGSRELKRREKLHQSPAIERGRRSNVFVDKLNIKGSPVKINKK